MAPKLPDTRNENIFIHVNGELLPREDAKISVFDSLVQGGDGVWEGLRVYNGKIFALDAHLDRLMDSAHAMAFAGIPTRDEVKKAIFETLEANGMRDGVHIRLTLSRGKKVTSSMDARVNQYGTTLIVIAEWKPPIYASSGVRLITSAIRRNPPQCVDSKIHHNNLINNILAKIEANVAGVDDAIMLDIHGYVSETNATNIFLIKRGEVLTPHADSCLPGITRGTVIQIARGAGIPLTERNVSLTEVYTADEVFTTGTVGELSPVLEVDGRKIGEEGIRPVTTRLQGLYAELTANEGESLRSEGSLLRNRNLRLKSYPPGGPLGVTMPDGKQIRLRHGSTTLIEVIKEIGIEAVEMVGLMSHTIPLVDTKDYLGTQQTRVGNYYIAVNTSTTTKIEQLEEIAHQLAIDLIADHL